MLVRLVVWQAPNPWLALNDVPCRGYETKSTREYDFCGYW